ncbi:hypothetical protein [Fibrella forsythiae]|uniref:Uncharacterized protein n=1 Tax=Fibrella forsythiae TaxID=2817061 RepID=A0ABS3JHY3_9BACT|nr:hypothetical protein [Fibrella forsythiae]MBO0949626.1 hypothetical protein [Fibrella forsythiae]
MNDSHQTTTGSNARFRISLLLLTGLLLVKLWTLGGRSQETANAQLAGQSGGFRPVAEENANVWGLAGSLLNLFSGGGSAARNQREVEDAKANQQASDQQNQERYWKEDEQRRADERDQREQDMNDAREQKKAEDQQYYDQRKAEQGY